MELGPFTTSLHRRGFGPRRPACRAVPALLSGLAVAAALAAQVSPGPVPPPPPPWTVQGDPDCPVENVAAAGDVNRDGFADVLVCRFNRGQYRGEILAHYGSAQGPSRIPNWRWRTAPDRPDLQSFAWAAGVGDIDRDGFADVMTLGASQPDAAHPHAYQLYLFPGSPAGLPRLPTWRFLSTESDLGDLRSLGPAGDVNGDGCADVCVVAKPGGNGPPFRARVLVFHGSRAGLGSQPDTQLEFGPVNYDLRLVAAGAGDVNGDGFGDVIVGDTWWRGAGPGHGRALVFYGSTNGLTRAPGWEATCDRALPHPKSTSRIEHFGWSVAAAGDIDGDGCGDVIVGAPWAEQDDVDEGLVFVYHGTRAGIERQPRRVIEGNETFALLGCLVGSAGDLNRDGLADVFVGQFQHSGSMTREGAVLAFLGARDGLAAVPHWSREGGDSNHQLGESACAAGDVNGDGFGDLLLADREFKCAQVQNGQPVNVKTGLATLCYGSHSGLTESSAWRLEKPLLAKLQAFHDRTPFAWKLAGAGLLLAAALGFFVAWQRALTRLRQSEHERARTEERRRVARNVHDHVGAALSEILHQSGGDKLGDDTPAHLRDKLGRINTRAKAGLDDMAQLIWAIDPAHDSLEDFAGHLIDHAQQYLDAANLDFDTEIPNPLPAGNLPPKIRTELSLIVKETLHNVVEHANAKSVSLRLRIDDHTLTLSITDDGQGFAVPANPGGADRTTSNGRGHGLRNLDARAQAIGAKLEILSRPGAGTSVTVAAPWRPCTQ